MCTRERTLQFQLTEEERERGEFSRTKRTRVVERGVKRAMAENAQFHARASLSRRAESAILARAGSGVVENAYLPLRPLPRRERPGPTLFADQRAESELSAGVQVSWKYWKAGGVEWLLPVSGTTILFYVEKRGAV